MDKSKELFENYLTYYKIATTFEGKAEVKAEMKAAN
jgi:hypothetical protein